MQQPGRDADVELARAVGGAVLVHVVIHNLIQVLNATACASFEDAVQPTTALMQSQQRCAVLLLQELPSPHHSRTIQKRIGSLWSHRRSDIVDFSTFLGVEGTWGQKRVRGNARCLFMQCRKS